MCEKWTFPNTSLWLRAAGDLIHNVHSRVSTPIICALKETYPIAFGGFLQHATDALPSPEEYFSVPLMGVEIWVRLMMG